MTYGKKIKFDWIFCLCIAKIIFHITTAQSADISLSSKYKIDGIWKFDFEKTFELRVKQGVPFHIGNKYGMGGKGRVIRQFDKGSYKFYDEKKFRFIDKGKFAIIESSSTEVALRLFPEEDFEEANKYKFQGLIRFAPKIGDNVPYIIGLRFIDNNIVQSFSYIRGFEGTMVKNDDNAYWRKIPRIPLANEKANKEIPEN